VVIIDVITVNLFIAMVSNGVKSLSTSSVSKSVWLHA
jgi:hypothetical protein